MPKVIENFHSIQGEGPYAGTPSYFIRFSGCSLACPYCDTKYAWNKEKGKDLKEVSAEIVNDIRKNLKTNHIVFTGGEPLLYYSDKEFVKFCHNIPVIPFITFETTTITHKEDIIYTNLWEKIVELDGDFLSRSAFIVSPKLEVECYPFVVDIDNIIRYYSKVKDINLPNVYFKIVYKKEYNEIIAELLGNLPKSFVEKKVFLMPFTPMPFDVESYRKSCVETVEFCKKTGVRYSPRIHLDLYGMKKGV